MNKRIEKLLEQATTIEVISGRGFDTTQYIERFDEETFAQLIIKECAKLIDSKRELGLDPGGDYLKAHFGVEE
jgi:hypothetical protein